MNANYSIKWLIFILCVSCNPLHEPDDRNIVKQIKIEGRLDLIDTQTIERRVTIPAQYETVTKRVLDSVSDIYYDRTIRTDPIPETYRMEKVHILNHSYELYYPANFNPNDPSQTVTLTINNRSNLPDTITVSLWDSSNSVTISGEKFEEKQVVIDSNTWIWKIYTENKKNKNAHLTLLIKGTNSEEHRKTIKLNIKRLSFYEKLSNLYKLSVIFVPLIIFSLALWYRWKKGKVDMESVTKGIIGKFEKEDEEE